MTLFLQVDAAGVGSGTVASNSAQADLVVVANDTGLGFDPVAGGRRRVTYAQTVVGPVQARLNELVNTAFTPDYGAGAGPQAVDIVVVGLPDNFVFGDGSFSTVNNGTALGPMGTTVPGATLNPTTNCLVLYDTDPHVCVARDGTGGDLDLPLTGPIVLYHELSHARRIVRNELLALTFECDPSSPEENAAIIDENDMRTQVAAMLGNAVVLRDPGIHCGEDCPSGGCCIVATLVSGSPRSPMVQSLRSIREHVIRSTETGYDFFDQLHYDYYAFSPQACTMMAGDLELQRRIRVGFVEPLIDFWRFVAERSIRPDLDDRALAQCFFDLVCNGDDPADRLALLRHVSATWDQNAHVDIPSGLRSLLQSEAWPRETIQWALIEPLRVSAEVLAIRSEGVDDQATGQRLREILDAWASMLPITPAWGALSSEQLIRELDQCERMLLQSLTAKQRFRDRLKVRFSQATTIQELEVQ